MSGKNYQSTNSFYDFVKSQTYFGFHKSDNTKPRGAEEFDKEVNTIATPPQIVRDLEIMNLSRNVSMTELKKQYHKFGILSLFDLV